MTIVLAKLTAITVIKNHSQGIHEVEWHQCDLRKELCAYDTVLTSAQNDVTPHITPIYPFI